MNDGVIYARFSPQPAICPTCQTRMSKMLGLDVFACATCDHVAEHGNGEQGSIQAQLESCRDYCARQDYKVVSEFYDEAMSGASLERPGLDEAIDALKRGDVLVVHMLDRLSRGDGGQWADIANRIAGKKARFESVSGEGTWGDDNPHQKLTRTVSAAVACFIRESGNLRTSQMMKEHQRLGRRMTAKSRVPFGSMVDPDDKSKLVANPDEQDIIGTIIATYNCVLQGPHRGKGYREVARRVNELGIKARNGGTIAHTLVAAVIRKHAAAS